MTAPKSANTTVVNAWEQNFTLTPPAKVPDWKPLQVKPHYRAADMEAYAAMPSEYSKGRDNGAR